MRVLLAIFTSLGVLIMLAGIAHAQPDEICFTWFAANGAAANHPQKLTYNYDGTFACYAAKDSMDPTRRGTYMIIKKWKDEEANVWYQIKSFGPGDESGYELVKISDQGRKLEIVRASDTAPLEVSANDNSYCQYVRR